MNMAWKGKDFAFELLQLVLGTLHCHLADYNSDDCWFLQCYFFYINQVFGWVIYSPTLFITALGI